MSAPYTYNTYKYTHARMHMHADEQAHAHRHTPKQVNPLPEKPALQLHSKLPPTLLQVALPSHTSDWHSSMSEKFV